MVRNINEDFLGADLKDRFDLVIGVDIVMQIISPLYDHAEYDFISKISSLLEKGGYLFLEIEDHSNIIQKVQENRGVYRIWKEFDASDPYQYTLNKISIDDDGNFVFEKTFILRDGSKQEYMKNVIKNYSRGQMVDLLSGFGYAVDIYSVGQNEIELDYKEDVFRVLARKL